MLRLSDKRLAYALAAVAFPFFAVCTFLHLRAPIALADDGITWVHGIAATLANLFGPWAAAIVRLVDFPNAGLRSFSLPMALGFTAALIGFLVLSFRTRRDALRWTCLVLFLPIVASWFFLGLLGIADGLL